jgi:hypothetical protein
MEKGVSGAEISESRETEVGVKVRIVWHRHIVQIFKGREIYGPHDECPVY